MVHFFSPVLMFLEILFRHLYYTKVIKRLSKKKHFFRKKDRKKCTAIP